MSDTFPPRPSPRQARETIRDSLSHVRPVSHRRVPALTRARSARIRLASPIMLQVRGVSREARVKDHFQSCCAKDVPRTASDHRYDSSLLIVPSTLEIIMADC